VKVYATILAGGKGERLWPASTWEQPKPFLLIGGGGRTLLRATYDRVFPLVGEGGVYVVVDGRLVDRVQMSLGLASDQIIVEPQGRNTAPAIGLAALILSLRDPEAGMIVLPSDHSIGDEGRFRRLLTTAVEAARQGHLVTFGITPGHPATGYGYIQRGDALESGVFRVRRFLEKPDLPTAERFIVEGGYYWNSGIFVWQASRILEEIHRSLPRLSGVLRKVASLHGTSVWQEKLTEVWPEVEAISVDYGIMERAEDVVVIPADVNWSDVGDWRAVWEVLSKDGAGVAGAGEHLSVDTCQTLIWASGGKPVVTLGTKDLVIVDTPEALLVADMNRTQEVREVVRRLGEVQGRREGRTEPR